MKITLRAALGAAAVVLLHHAPIQAQTYQQVWADEFEGSISPSWQFETGGGGWGNNEKQYYQADNASVANGNLLITARRQNMGGLPYTSARMITRGLKEFTYGKIEARIKLPLGQGLWPAFWMLGGNINSVGWPKCGEIDIMEHINSENKIYGTAHWDNNGHAEYGGNTITTPQDYHVYSVEWDATAIRWFLDGTQYHVINILNNAGGTEELHRPFFLLLNLAVAGNWPGQTVDESKLPATMYVDYVRVYQKTTDPQPGNGVATVFKNCNYDGAAVALPAGDYTLGALQSRGILNDDISSLKVNAGYQVVLYEHDNFGGASLTVRGDNGCLVSNALGAGNWNDKPSSLRVQPASSSSSVTLQAEAYSNMQGVQVEACSEGGQNVGYIDATDWLVYNNVNFPSSGSYTIEYRVASPGGSRLSADLNGGSIQLGNIDIPATGGWQTWTTVSQTVNVNAGTYNFGVYAQAGGWNLNWIRISKNGARPAAASAAAEPTVSVALYPNPVTDHLTLTGLAKGVGQVSIRNMQGREVWSGFYAGKSLDVSGLEPGLYTLVLTGTGHQKQTLRFSKQ